MQRHVSLLDALGDERAQGREVLAEADRAHDLRELARGLGAEEAAG
jgi:hypothetical protein